MLPGLDDGAPDEATSLELLSQAIADGITTCVATPHWAPGQANRLASTAVALAERSGMKILVGQELVLSPRLADQLQAGEALTLAGTRSLLLETASLEEIAFSGEAIFRLQALGFRVILAHPERNPRWQRQSDRLFALAERGCVIQINAGSVLGEFGSDARRLARSLLRAGHGHLLASDAHCPRVRPQRLSKAVRVVADLIGDSQSRALVWDHPQAILEERPLPAVSRPSRPGFLTRLLRHHH